MSGTEDENLIASAFPIWTDKDVPKVPPTIAELEAMIHSGTHDVKIKPDGTVLTTEKKEAADLISALAAKLDSVLNEYPPLSFTYTNYRGERKDRKVRILGLRYGTSEYYTRPDWLMRAYDIEGEKEREFSVANMSPLGAALVNNYDMAQVTLGMREIAQSMTIVCDSLLENLKKGASSVFKLGGAGVLLERNVQRLDHIAKRLGGVTDAPFVYVPVGPETPQGEGSTPKTLG